MFLGLIFVWGFSLFLYDPNQHVTTEKVKTLEVVTGKTFRNEQVVIDGRAFYKNKFYNVTLFTMEQRHLKLGLMNFWYRVAKTNNRRAESIVALLLATGIATLNGELIQPPGSNVELNCQNQGEIVTCFFLE